jgi:hypothetical protein
MFRLLLVFILCLIFKSSNAQIFGTVTDQSGEPLAFASVYFQNTSLGVSTNADGYYSLNPGQNKKFILICQYLGYETFTSEVNYEGRPIRVDLTLMDESILAPTIEINADSEDPAYAIIRQAIKQRKYHAEKIQSLSCQSYIKGRFDVEEVPKMMLEVMINDMNVFDVDSNGAGIVYLSESESTYHKDKPDKVKEVMHSSVISGFDNEFSFNNAMSMDFSLYDNNMGVIRNIVSPIANGALFYYDYKLLGTTFDEKGRLLNKILVIPKSKTSPTFSGILYVLENQWSVPKADLILTGDHAQEALIDSIRFKYAAIEVAEDTWVDFQKNIWMRIKIFGFSASGGFNGVFSNFKMNPNFEPGFFDREIFKAEAGSNKKSEAYWDSIRPIPLTAMEEINYTTMDSLKVIRKNRQDSIINHPPKFKVLDIVSGYNRYFDQGRFQMEYALLNEGGFNTVQGYHLGGGVEFYTNVDSIHEPGWSVGGHWGYGFSDNGFRGGIHYTRKTNNDAQLNWTVAAGRYFDSYRLPEPMHPFANTIYSLLQEKNYAKFFEKDAIGFEVKTEWLNGISMRSFAAFEQRRALVNTSDHSWAKAEYRYLSNNPVLPSFDAPAFTNNAHLAIGFESRVVFGQKYISYPNRIFKIGSKYPVLHIAASFDRNFEIDQNFIHVKLGLSDSYSWHVAGDGGWNANFGAFLLDKPSFFTDFKHFDGNLTIFGSPYNYLNSFHLLPYYSHSTNDKYIEAHYQHHFRGFILDKIPLVRLLKWNVAAGANFLYTPDRGKYAELYVGVENIGINFLRFLRADLIFNFNDDGFIKSDYMIGLNIGEFINLRNSKKKQIDVSF